MSRLAIAIIFALALAACSETAPITTRCAVDSDCEGASVCLDGSCIDHVELDLGRDVDAVQGDAGDGGNDASQELGFDALSPDEGDDADELLGFGEACAGDDECLSGLCVDSDDGRICTQLCNEDCPDGFVCRLLVNTGGDAVRLCVPELDVQCLPCSNHTECGGLVDFCVPQANGEFCALNCAADRICPEGYGCNPHTIEDAGDAGEPLETWLCEPLLGACNPFRVTSSTVTGGGVPLSSTRYRVQGQIIWNPHVSRGGGYTVYGGF